MSTPFSSSASFSSVSSPRLTPYRQPQCSSEIPIQHIKVINLRSTPTCCATLNDYMKFSRVDDASEASQRNLGTAESPMYGANGSMHNRGLATDVSIWIKRGPAQPPWPRWEVPPITSITLVLGDAASAREAGFTLVPIDISPSFHTSMLMGSLLLGYR